MKFSFHVNLIFFDENTRNWYILDYDIENILGDYPLDKPILCSEFLQRAFYYKKLDASGAVSMLLGLIAAIGNGIPGAGFSIKGVTSTSKKLMSLEKPSLLAMLFVLPAIFSGFTTHKAMADSLKELGYSGNVAEALKWIANLGAALIYNLPQMLNLADSLTATADNDQLNNLKKHLEIQVKNLDASDVKNFKTGLPNTLSNFFNTYHPAENTDRQHYPLLNINSSA
ncbi:hypothetical protein FQR65_LT05295 [Abscondita terminalis]|nr:hypothetical protein FQR65_LT05295 [Abscondita terminalis]